MENLAGPPLVLLLLGSPNSELVKDWKAWKGDAAGNCDLGCSGLLPLLATCGWGRAPPDGKLCELKEKNDVDCELGS